MIKNITELVYSIERYTVDAKNKFISVEIATGTIVDETFIADRRGLINHRIADMSDKTTQQTDILTVDAVGQVMLSRTPIDNNPIELNGVPQDHISGQLITCSEYAGGDEVTVAYYYNEQGRAWFSEATAFVAGDHPEYTGMNDYEYNSARLWAMLLEMGLVSGVII